MCELDGDCLETLPGFIPVDIKKIHAKERP